MTKTQSVNSKYIEEDKNCDVRVDKEATCRTTNIDVTSRKLEFALN